MSGPEATADKLIRSACAIAGVDRGVLFQRDPTDPRRMVAVAGVGPAAEVVGQTFSSDRGLAGEAMTTGEPVITNDYTQLPTRLVTEFERPVHAACAVPLVEHGHTAAAISLASTDPSYRFTEAEIERLRDISQQWEDVRRQTGAPRGPFWRTWPTVVLAVLALGLWTVRVLTDQRLSSKPAAPSTPPPASTALDEQHVQIGGLTAGQAVPRCVAMRGPGARGAVDVDFALTGALARNLAIDVEEGRLPAGPRSNTCRGFVASETLVRGGTRAQPVVISYEDWPASGLRSYRITLSARRGLREDLSHKTAVLAVRAFRSR